jgi:hypothetical protein
VCGSWVQFEYRVTPASCNAACAAHTSCALLMQALSDFKQRILKYNEVCACLCALLSCSAVHICLHTHICMHICTCTYVHGHMYMHICTCTYVCMCRHMSLTPCLTAPSYPTTHPFVTPTPHHTPVCHSTAVVIRCMSQSTIAAFTTLSSLTCEKR